MPDIKRCADHVVEHLKSIGLCNVQSFNNYGNPILYAEHLNDPTYPTLLCYGHYDVQPVDPLDQWVSSPFDPMVDDEYIYARGASDNKGMFYAQLKAVESYLKSNTPLYVNLKFIIEGEEEIGSHGLNRFLVDHESLLAHDALLVSDNPMFSESQPSVCTSVRGLIYLECNIRSMNHDVHSGQLGGGVPNLIHYVSDCIKSLKDPITNKILIPGFYDGVSFDFTFDSDSNEAAKNLSFLNSFFNLGQHANSNFYQNIWSLPTLDCNGIQSGFIENGAKTVIPCEAMFKLSCRLVQTQCPTKLFNLIKQYIVDFFLKALLLI